MVRKESPIFQAFNPRIYSLILEVLIVNRLALIVAFIFMNLPAAFAGAVTLTFEDIPNLTFVNSFYATQPGDPEFYGFISYNGGGLAAHSGTMKLVGTLEQTEIDFVGSPVDTISLYYSGGIALTIEAFDASNNLLGVVGTTSGSSYSQYLMSLTAPGEISKVLFLTQPGGGNNYIIDDFSYAYSDQSAVPEPGGVSLLAMGVAAFIARRRKYA